MSIDFNLVQVTENTIMGSHEAGRSNAGAVILDDFIVAIDCTMWPQTARLFRLALEEKYQKPVKYLFVTHSHGDHVLGLTAFKDLPILASVQLPISFQKRLQYQWSPQQMLEMKESGMAPPEWVEEVEFIIPPISFYQKMDLLNGQKKIEFHHSGGHSDDSSWAYYPDEKVLFAGDLIFSEMFPFAGDDSCDPEKWMDVCRTWLDMPIEKVIAGHGPVMGLDIVERTLQFYEQLKQNTLDAIAKNKTAEEIVKPDQFTIQDPSSWLITKTLEHWYQYYSELK